MDVRKSASPENVSALVGAVAEQLRAERAAAGVTIDTLAKRSGVSRNTVMRFESGERSPNVVQLDAICSALGLDLTTMLTRAQERVDSGRHSERRNTGTGR